MRLDRDPGDEEKLLRALLGDEAWQEKNASAKAGALSAFCAHHRSRRLKRWLACVMALVMALGLGLHWFGDGRKLPHGVVGKPMSTPALVQGPRRMTDEELLASFPAGSCFLAEVDGKKELVFLDPDVERIYVSNGYQRPQ